jgi:hypothetical protein
MKLLPTGKPKEKKPEDGCRGCCHQMHRRTVLMHPDCEKEYLAHVGSYQEKHAGKLRYNRVCVVCDKSLRKKPRKIRLCKECKIRKHEEKT